MIKEKRRNIPINNVICSYVGIITLFQGEIRDGKKEKRNSKNKYKT